MCACHFPNRVILLFFLLPVPIWLFVLFQVAQDTFIFLSGTQSQTAVTVHLAGAGFAYLYFKFQWRLTGWLPSFRSWRFGRTRPRLRIYRAEDERSEAVTVSAPTSPSLDEQLEAKLDAVLAKVARSGQESLTDSERQILLRASEIYRRRRS
jgi:hypothetical protein